MGSSEIPQFQDSPPARSLEPVHSMSSSGPAAEGEGTPAQPASEKEPEMPDPREESEEEDEDDEEEEEEEEEEKGKGQKLCEIERIHFFLSKKKTDELRNLHKLLYNRPGTVSSLKKNVGQFSGFPFEKGSVQYKKKEEMLKKFRNAMLKSICEVLDLERSGVNSELVKRILNFLMHPKPSGKPLPKSKKSSSKGNKKERNSSGMARKAKRTKCPEILSDESSSDEDEKKNKEESSDDEDKESEEEQPPKKTSKREKPKQKATSKSKKTVKSANVKKADSSTTKKNQNSSKKESESEDSSDDEPLIKKLKKPPTDEELKETVKKLLASANLEEVTMKQICKEVIRQILGSFCFYLKNSSTQPSVQSEILMCMCSLHNCLLNCYMFLQVLGRCSQSVSPSLCPSEAASFINNSRMCTVNKAK
uniref:DEK proto-onco n=1 Tax=Ailuropoda melanoleuca TaxID=9646 RepID=A0A7N5K818_AILME